MLEIKVRIKPGSKEAQVKEVINVFGDKEYEVYVKNRPFKGLANKEMAKLLSEHFGVTKKDIEIKSGFTSRYKTVFIHEV